MSKWVIALKVTGTYVYTEDEHGQWCGREGAQFATVKEAADFVRDVKKQNQVSVVSHVPAGLVMAAYPDQSPQWFSSGAEGVREEWRSRWAVDPPAAER